MAIMRSNIGEISVMSHEEKHLIWIGVLGGAVISGLAMLLIFGMVLHTLDYPDSGLLLAIATVVGVVAGAALGPIITLVMKRRTARSLGL